MVEIGIVYKDGREDPTDILCSNLGMEYHMFDKESMGTIGLMEIVEDLTSTEEEDMIFRDPKEIKIILHDCKKYIEKAINVGEEWDYNINETKEEIDSLIEAVEVAISTNSEIALAVG